MTVRSKERCYKVTFDGKLTRVVCDAKIFQSPAKSIVKLPQPVVWDYFLIFSLDQIFHCDFFLPLRCMRVRLLKNQAYFKFNSLNLIFQNKICSVYFDKRKKYFYSLFVWHHGSFILFIIYRCIRSPGFCLFLHLTKLHSKLHLFHYFVFLSVVFCLFIVL